MVLMFFMIPLREGTASNVLLVSHPRGTTVCPRIPLRSLVPLYKSHYIPQLECHHPLQERFSVLNLYFLRPMYLPFHEPILDDAIRTMDSHSYNQVRFSTPLILMTIPDRSPSGVH